MPPQNFVTIEWYSPSLVFAGRKDSQSLPLVTDSAQLLVRGDAISGQHFYLSRRESVTALTNGMLYSRHNEVRSLIWRKNCISYLRSGLTGRMLYYRQNELEIVFDTRIITWVTCEVVWMDSLIHFDETQIVVESIEKLVIAYPSDNAEGTPQARSFSSRK